MNDGNVMYKLEKMFIRIEINSLHAGEPNFLFIGYTSKADCWSLGFILYVLLSGKHPFSKGEEMVSQIMQGKVRRMTGMVWDKVTITAKSLVWSFSYVLK